MAEPEVEPAVGAGQEEVVADAIPTPTADPAPETSPASFDLDSLMTLSFNPLKGVLEHLLARMDKQDETIAQVADHVGAKTTADQAGDEESKADEDGDTRSKMTTSDRLAEIEALLGLDRAHEEGSDSVADRLAALQQQLSGADGQGTDKDRIAALERRVTELEHSVETNTAGADGSSATGSDGDSGESGSAADGGEGGAEGGAGLGSVSSQLADLRGELTALREGGSSSGGGGADGSGSTVGRAEFEALETRETESERRIEELEKAVAKAQRTADAARAAAMSGGSRKGSTSTPGGEDEDDDSGVRRAVRNMGATTETAATEEAELGVGSGDGSLGLLRQSSGTGSRPTSAGLKSISPRQRPRSGNSSPALVLEGVLGRGSPNRVTTGSEDTQARESAAQALEASKLASSELEKLRAEVDALRASLEERMLELQKQAEEDAAKRSEASQKAIEAAKKRAQATGGDGESASGGGGGGETAELALADAAAALAGVDDVAARQHALEQELDRVRSTAKQAADTADTAGAAVRAMQRRSVAATMDDDSKSDAGVNGGSSGGDGLGLGTTRAVASSTCASLSAVTGLARALAGTAGVPPERVEELSGPADTAVEDLRRLVAKLEEAALTDGAGGSADQSRALEAIGNASNTASAAVERLLEQTMPLAQGKASQSDVAALRRMVGHVEAEAGKAQAGVRELRSRTEEQLAAVLTGQAGAMGGPGAAGSSGRSGADGVSDEEMAELWDTLAQKADLDELRGLASVDAVAVKADRRELSRLKGLLDKLWRHVEAQGKGKGGQAQGDWAFLTGRPLKDYSCLSCGHKLETLVEPPSFHVPTAALPASGSTRRRSPQPGSRPTTPQQAAGGQSVVLPNGTVFRRPPGASPATGHDDSGAASASGSGRPASGRGGSAQARRSFAKQSETAFAAPGGPSTSTTGVSLPPIA